VCRVGGDVLFFCGNFWEEPGSFEGESSLCMAPVSFEVRGGVGGEADAAC